MTAAAVQSAFDALAREYDGLWSHRAIGREQRAAVWREVDPLFHAGDRILDLGCGTGVDAVHFRARGIEVLGLDASAAMVRVARSRGVDARHLPLESLAALHGRFDGAISNFGALNCVADLLPVASGLARLIRPGGRLAICVAGRCCAWETVYYLARRHPRKAARRWAPGGSRASLGIHVYYPTIRRLLRLFGPDFRLVRWRGIGLAVPPSYVDAISDAAIARLGALDRRIAHWPVLRGLADHRLLLLERV